MELEHWVLETMPELKQKRAVETDREAAQNERKAEQEKISLQGAVPIADRVNAALYKSTDRKAFESALEACGLKLYIRGKTPGVIDLENGKKHRLRTLGDALLQAFECLPDVAEVEIQEEMASAGEKEKSAAVEVDTGSQQHQLQKQEAPETKEQWKAELDQLRSRHEKDLQAQAENTNALLREVKALVRFAVRDTLQGIRSRALMLLERLKLKPQKYEHECK